MQPCFCLLRTSYVTLSPPSDAEESVDVSACPLSFTVGVFSLCQCGVWETLLTALEILIRVHHPHQVFNICQFLKAEIVHRFLLTCQVLQVGHCHEVALSIPLISSEAATYRFVFVSRSIGTSIWLPSRRKSVCHLSKSSRRCSGLLRTWTCWSWSTTSCWLFTQRPTPTSATLQPVSTSHYT